MCKNNSRRLQTGLQGQPANSLTESLASAQMRGVVLLVSLLLRNMLCEAQGTGGAILSSGWLINTTYSGPGCTGTPTQMSVRSFDTCYKSPISNSAVRLYCVQPQHPGPWVVFEQGYSDDSCTNPRANTNAPAVPINSGTACDSSGRSIRCVRDLSSAPLQTAPRGFIESAYSSPLCEESKVMERTVTPAGGCTLVQVERTDSMPNGEQVPLAQVSAFLKVSSCEWVNSGYILFGTIHSDSACSDPGRPTRHTLPRGCMAKSDGPTFYETFTCG